MAGTQDLRFIPQKHQLSKEGVINSTAVTHNLPLPNLPFSHINQSDHSEQIVRDLRSDPTIANHLLDEALSKLSSDSDHQRSGLESSAPPADWNIYNSGINHQGSASKYMATPTSGSSDLSHQGQLKNY